MKYCTRCLLPSTKPHIRFDELGVCTACKAHEKKKSAEGGIDWNSREKEFLNLVNEAKAKKAPLYDAVVPVSGGKDSITQVHRLKIHGLRILTVNVDYGIKTEIGRQNLDVIPNKLGAHLITYRPEQELHRKIMRIGFEEFGDPDLLSHALLHAYPVRVALQFKVPLVLLGENSAFEYGGDADLAASKSVSRKWFSKFAANQGMDARVIAEKYKIPFEKLVMYDFPDELETSKETKAEFMSYYFHWDSEEHLKIARGYGFKNLQERGEGTYRNYVGIDEKINRIHQHMKVLKFGYGRATDHACEDIRGGRLTREEAKKLVRAYDTEPLSDFFVNDFIAYLGITRTEFDAVIDKFRNREIWKQEHGKWIIPNHLEE